MKPDNYSLKMDSFKFIRLEWPEYQKFLDYQEDNKDYIYYSIEHDCMFIEENFYNKYNN